MNQASITIEFDPDQLSAYTDQRLALLWHLVQANPADGFEHSQPGDLAMRVGWEIIRRWLERVPPELYSHQQSHYARHQLGKFAIYRPGSPEFHDGHYEPRMIPDTRELRDALAAKLADLKVFASGSLTREQIAQELARIVLPQQDAGDAEPAHAAPMLQRLRDAQDQDTGAGADE
jgi:hypothetical protein